MDNRTAPNPLARNASITQEQLNQVQTAITQDMAYWTTRLSEASDPVHMFKRIRHCMSALEYEASAAKRIQAAIQAEAAGLGADASVYEARAHADLGFALSDWQFALAQVADNSPFDPYRSTTTERTQRAAAGDPDREPPTRITRADLQEISALLHHLYHSMDRVHALGRALTQAHLAYLTTSLIEAETTG